jgi:hypothetical protein
MFERNDTIHRNSREQAIQDGTLIDASKVAHEAGFRFPVALTRDAWEKCVTVPKGILCQDEEGRLWDVLHMLFGTIRRGQDGAEISFLVHVRNGNRPTIPPAVKLRAIVGPGDDGAPVTTIMLFGED